MFYEDNPWGSDPERRHRYPVIFLDSQFKIWHREFVPEGQQSPEMPPPEPIGSDVVFGGWYKGDWTPDVPANSMGLPLEPADIPVDFTGIAVDFAGPNPVIGPTIYFPKWRPVPSICVTFMADGQIHSRENYNIGDRIRAPKKAPEKPGYSFEGWCDEMNPDTLVDAESILAYKDRTFIPKWKELRRVVIAREDGTIEREIPNIADGDKLPRYEPVPLPYREYLGCFLGASDREWDWDWDTVTENRVLITRYKVVEHTVNFQRSPLQPWAPAWEDEVRVVHGSRVRMPELPEDARCTCVGWFADEDLLEPFDFGTPIEAAVTLYAKWVREFTLTYNASGGVFRSTGSDTLVMKLAEGERFTEPAEYPAPPQTNQTSWIVYWYRVNSSYVEERYFGGGGCNCCEPSPITEDVTLHAEWHPCFAHVSAGPQMGG